MFKIPESNKEEMVHIGSQLQKAWYEAAWHPEVVTCRGGGCSPHGRQEAQSTRKALGISAMSKGQCPVTFLCLGPTRAFQIELHRARH